MNDLRYGARLLRRSPSFALTAVVSLAVGLGATIAIFTIGNGLLLRSASGVTDPGRLVDIVVTLRGAPGIVPIAFADYLELRSRADMLEGLFGYELEVTTGTIHIDIVCPV